MYYYIFLMVLLSSCSTQKTSSDTVAKVLSSPLLTPLPDQPFCFFVPPEGWLVSDPEKLLSSVQLGFLKKQEGFCPSLNLAVEPIDISQEEYLQTVQKIHEAHHAEKWRRLGKIATKAGLADLTELDMLNPFGKVRLLQLLLVKEGFAYTLTAAALEKEISSYYSDFEKAFSSLQISYDLLEGLSAEEREALSTLEKFPSDAFNVVEQEVRDRYANKGMYWQLLFLKHFQQRHFP